MYADLDFFLALLKENDWLKENAEKIFKKHHRQTWTSGITLQEIMLYAIRENHSINEYLERIIALVKVKGTVLIPELCLAAADLMRKHGCTIFDAFHAIISDGDVIVSSDKINDTMGLRRIKLEQR